MIHRFLPLVFLVGALLPLCGCSNEAVQKRQEAISGVHSNVTENRATRIKARDERMWESRDVWFQ